MAFSVTTFLVGGEGGGGGTSYLLQVLLYKKYPLFSIIF